MKNQSDLRAVKTNAFYFHYQYKEDLYDAIIDNVSNIIVESLIPVVPTENMIDNMTFYAYSEKLIDGFYSISDNLKSLLINDNGELEKKITLICYNKISSNILTFYNVNDSQKVHLISNYVASSLVGFMLNLISNKESDKKMAVEILSNLFEGTNNSILKLLT